MEYDTKYVKDNLEKYGNSEVRGFFEFLEEQELSTGSMANYAKMLRFLKGIKRPYKHAEKKDIKRAINTMKKEKGKGSVTLYKTLIKRFFQWVHYGDGVLPGGKYYKVYPEVVRWLTNGGNGKGKRKMPKDILSRQEIKRLLDKCNNQRDRALIFVLYESGTRASEFLGLNISDVAMDKIGAVISVDGKTGQRRLRLFEAIPDLTDWLNRHPDKDNPEAPLWITQDGNRMSIRRLNQLIKIITKRAKITKNVHPHGFRHARATHLATVLTEAQMKEFFGWEKTSTMPGIYVHLSGRDVDKTLLKHYGHDIAEEEKEEDTTLKPRPCPRKCKEDGRIVMYSPSDKFCRLCGATLDLKTALEMEETKKGLGKVQEIGFREGLLTPKGIKKLMDKEEVKAIMKEVLTEEIKVEAKRLIREGKVKI